MNNIDYFNYSVSNEDEIVDISKQEGVLVISKDNIYPDTELMKWNHRLIELITTYKVLKESNTEDFKIYEFVDQIVFIIDNVNLINYSSFCAYFQVIGYSYSAYQNEKNKLTKYEKRNLMIKLLDLYIKNRHNMYLYHGYSDQVLQVGADTSSSRRKSKTGIEIMESFLIPLGFTKATHIDCLTEKDYLYILPDKGQENFLEEIIFRKGIDFNFRTIRDSKNPDMLLKINNDIYILEHKLTNGNGGSQNAEINEIIQFIGYGEKETSVHYISCLAGNYFKKLNDKNREPKVVAQLHNIKKNLSTFTQNYFVNEKGFEKLIGDIVEEDKKQNVVENVR